MTIHGVDGRERHSGRYAPLENAGILRCAQNDDVKLTRAKTRTGWENVYIPTLATIKPSRRCGTRAYFGWFRRDNDNNNSNKQQRGLWLGYCSGFSSFFSLETKSRRFWRSRLAWSMSCMVRTPPATSPFLPRTGAAVALSQV